MKKVEIIDYSFPDIYFCYFDYTFWEVLKMNSTHEWYGELNQLRRLTK